MTTNTTMIFAAENDSAKEEIVILSNAYGQKKGQITCPIVHFKCLSSFLVL